MNGGLGLILFLLAIVLGLAAATAYVWLRRPRELGGGPRPIGLRTAVFL